MIPHTFNYLYDTNKNLPSCTFGDEGRNEPNINQQTLPRLKTANRTSFDQQYLRQYYCVIDQAEQHGQQSSEQNIFVSGKYCNLFGLYIEHKTLQITFTLWILKKQYHQTSDY